MAWSNEGALKTGASGAAIGSAFGPWGTAIGGAAGALIGGFVGGSEEKKQEDYTNRSLAPLSPENYTSFLSLPEGQQLKNALQSTIDTNYKKDLRGGIIGNAQGVMARGTLSSSMLNRENDVLRGKLGENKATEINAMNENLAGKEYGRRVNYEDNELKKKLLVSQIWQNAGTANAGNYQNIINTLTNAASGFAMNKLINQYGGSGTEPRYSGG